MKRFFGIAAFCLLGFTTWAQVNKDSIHVHNDREKAFSQLLDLHEDGALVFRVILNKRNVALYRKAGKHKVADRIERKQNRRISLLAKAFLDSTFSFCPVYVIDAKDYKRVLNGEKNGYFLDANLKVDSSIVFREKSIYFVDIGRVYETISKNGSFKSSEVTSTPTLLDALVIKDEKLNQLIRPFPFCVALDRNVIDRSDVSTYVLNLIKGKVEKDKRKKYSDYLAQKYNVEGQDLFLMDRVYFLNLRLFTYHLTAQKYFEKKGIDYLRLKSYD